MQLGDESVTHLQDVTDQPSSGGLEFSPGSTHYLLSIRDSASNQTECKRNLKLVLMVGARVDEEKEIPRSLAAAAMVSVNKPRRQLQRRLVEEEAVNERMKETLLYQSLSMSRQSEEGRPSISDSDGRILAKLVSSSSSCSKSSVSYVILLAIIFTLFWPSDKA